MKRRPPPLISCKLIFLLRVWQQQSWEITNSPEEEVGEEFSPDGRTVSYARDNNLYVVDVASGRERALTNDGSAKILNGRLDWVYQEELYGRGNFKGYWWSPDSTRIAYLRIDENPVREFTVVDHILRRKRRRSPPTRKRRSEPSVKLGISPVAADALARHVYIRGRRFLDRKSWMDSRQQKSCLPDSRPRADLARSEYGRRDQRQNGHDLEREIESLGRSG